MTRNRTGRRMGRPQEEIRRPAGVAAADRPVQKMAWSENGAAGRGKNNAADCAAGRSGEKVPTAGAAAENGYAAAGSDRTAAKRPAAAQRREILVNGYAYPSIAPETLQSWLPDLTFLSPFSYGVTPEGGLLPLTDQGLIAAAGAAGAMSLMVLTPMNEEGAFSNELVRQILENPRASENLLNNIEAILREKDYFGVDFDFEYVYEHNRDQYTALVEAATLRFNPQGFVVTVALAPKTSADQQGLLYQGHDYYGMGQAANFILLMTYEWGYTYGPPLPVAPVDQVRRVLDYGVSEIPPDKILMGIPNYGYDWTLPFVQGESRAEKISNDEAIARAARYGAEIQYDTAAQAPFYFYWDVDGRQHEVWFENAGSWRAKLALIGEYGLAGMSIWNVMDDFAAGQQALRELYQVGKV